MSKKNTASRERRLSEQLAKEWELAHPPGQPAITESAWSVDCEYGEISFANFDSAYAYANGLTLGDFRRKVINRERKMIEVWLSPDRIHQKQNTQADAAGLPC